MKAKFASLLCCVLLLTQVFSVILAPGSAFADSKVASMAINSEKRLKSFLYLSAFYDCLDNFSDKDLAPNMTIDQTDLGELFAASTKTTYIGKWLGDASGKISCKEAANKFYQTMNSSTKVRKNTFSDWVLKDAYIEDVAGATIGFQCKYEVGAPGWKKLDAGPFTWPQGYYEKNGVLYNAANMLGMSPITIYYKESSGVTGIKFDGWIGTYVWDTWPSKTTFYFRNLDNGTILESIRAKFTSKTDGKYDLKSICNNIVTGKVQIIEWGSDNTEHYHNPGNPLYFEKQHPKYTTSSDYWNEEAHIYGDDYKAEIVSTDSGENKTYVINTDGSKKAVTQIKNNIKSLYLDGSTPSEYLDKQPVVKYQLLGRYMFNGDGGFSGGCIGVTLSEEDAKKQVTSGKSDIVWDSARDSTAKISAYVVGQTDKQSFVTHFGEEGKTGNKKSAIYPIGGSSEYNCGNGSNDIATMFNGISLAGVPTAYKSQVIDIVFGYMNPSKVSVDPDDPDGACPPGFSKVGDECQSDTNSGDGTPIDLGGDSEEVQSTCNIGAIGWIVCPVLNFLGGIAEGIYQWIETNFLQVRTQLVNTSSGTHDAWTKFRDIANAVFVILFLIVIFSQITSIGISNYGIKKMLPRIITAAILINLSYFICQLAVDLSNIVGSQIGNLLKSLGKQILAKDPQIFTDWSAGTGGAGVAGGIIGAVLAVTVIGALAWANIGALALMLISVALSALMIFVLLTLRQAAVVMLVAVSPLAFVCYMLPNTKGIFSKWLTFLKAMLLLYPICGLVVGAGYLTSCILQAANTTNPETPDLEDVSSFDIAGNEANRKSWIMQIVASSLRFLPFLVIPSLLKGSMNAVGNIGAKINGASAKLNGSAGNRFKNSRAGIAAGGHDKGVAAKKAQIRAGQYKGRNPLSKLRSVSNGFINSKTGKGGALYMASGINAANKAEKDDIEMYKTTLSGMDKSEQYKFKRSAVRRNDSAAIQAAVQHMSGEKDIAGMRDFVGSLHEGAKNPKQHAERLAAANKAALSDPNLKLEDYATYNYLKGSLDSNGNVNAGYGSQSEFEESGQAMAGASQKHYDNMHSSASASVARADAIAEAKATASGSAPRASSFDGSMIAAAISNKSGDAKARAGFENVVTGATSVYGGMSYKDAGGNVQSVGATQYIKTVDKLADNVTASVTDSQAEGLSTNFVNAVSDLNGKNYVADNMANAVGGALANGRNIDNATRQAYATSMNGKYTTNASGQAVWNTGRKDGAGNAILVDTNGNRIP